MMTSTSAVKNQILSRRLWAFLLLCFSTVLAATQQQPAPVVLAGKTVITIRWGYANYTPQIRAQAVSDRLQKIAAEPSVPIDCSLRPSQLGIDILCGNNILATVFAGDAQAEHTSTQALAEQWSQSFRSAMQSYRHEFGWRTILVRVLLALLTIVVVVWALILLHRYTRRMAEAATSMLEQKVTSTHATVSELISHSLLQRAVLRAFALLRFALVLVIVAIAIHTLLGIFPRTRPLALYLYHGVAEPTHAFLRSAWSDLPSILFIILLAIVTWYIIKIVRYFFLRVSQGAITLQGFRPAWSTVTERLVSIAIVVLAVLIAYPYIPGSQSPAFKGVSIFLGVLVSLGSTGLVSNVITGVMLTYLDAFEIGDLIEIGEITGYVKSTSLLTTRLVTRKNEVITVPNSFIMGKHITNFSERGGRDGLLISTTVGIGYEVPWRQVEAMLLEGARRTESVASDPAPFVVIVLLDNYSVNYEVNAYLKAGTRRYMGITELNHNVLDVFNEYGIAIMTPSYMSDPAEPKVVARDQWYAAPAAPGQSPAVEKRDYPPPRPSAHP